MDEETRLVLRYLVGMVIAIIVAGGGALLLQLQGTAAIDWRPVITAALAAFISGLAGMRLPRQGSAALSTQVDIYRTLGYHRRDLTILPKSGAEPDVTVTKEEV